MLLVAHGELAPALLLSTPPVIFKREQGALHTALMKICVDGMYGLLPASDVFIRLVPEQYTRAHFDSSAKLFSLA